MYITGIFLFITVSHISVVEVADSKNYYRAAVFDQVRFGNYSSNKDNILSKNLQMYETAARTAAENDVDIIVYPEWGLYPNPQKIRNWALKFAEDIPDPHRTYSNPCEQSTNASNPILTKLSCIAKENRIYLVANTADYKKCSNSLYCEANAIDSCSSLVDDCPEDGVYLYNTNIIFNREGTLIAKYYKKHLFYEFDMNNSGDSDDVFFDTDFGKFTTFICFDLVFKDAVEAVERSGVQNVIFTSHWFDHLPLFYISVAYQSAWAAAHKVNLLSTNGHVPGTGSIGSGIYSGSLGALVYTHNPDGRSKLLISNVPNVSDVYLTERFNSNVKKFYIDKYHATEIKGHEKGEFKGKYCEISDLGLPEDPINDYRCNAVNNTGYKFLKIEKPEGALHSCAHNICCHLTYESKNINEEYYLGIVGDKLVFRDTWAFGTEGCFLARCDSINSGTCKKYALKSKTVFEMVEITANFSTKYVYPYALNSHVRLTQKSQWHFNGENKITYKNHGLNLPLLFLGMYGRRYDQDLVLNV